MQCYITQSGSFLPGPPVENDDIERHLGTVDGEQEIKRTVLRMNGIVGRHYAQDEQQNPTHDVYQLAAQAVQACLCQREKAVASGSLNPGSPVSYLAAGTTHAPLSGPGMSSILHDHLQKSGRLNFPLEISSHSGICTSGAAAMVSAIRAVRAGEHASAICVGAEHPSSALKSSVIRPVDDRADHADIRKSQWFMSVFLRFMLSDGAGAFLLENQPVAKGLSLRVNWTHSLSLANEAPLCMKFENGIGVLSQDINILSRHLVPCARKFLTHAMQTHDDEIDSYQMILPHMSSFFFRKKMERVMREHSQHPDSPVPYWTNLATVGNTGTASIYIMLDHYLEENTVRDGDRLLLFIPESGQFNFVMVSLTAVVQ